MSDRERRSEGMSYREQIAQVAHFFWQKTSDSLQNSMSEFLTLRNMFTRKPRKF